MLLSKILADVEYKSDAPSELIDSLEIADITYDSRRATADTMFVCLIGAVSDGHNYAAGAYDCGCRVFMVQRQLDTLAPDAVQIVTADTRAALALASAALFGYPSRSLLIIGVTGTKGKTTTAAMIGSILNAGGINTATIGTTGIVINGETTPTKNTTPESYELHKAFRKMVDSGVSCVVMEVSSQAIYMRRVVGIHFHIGVFTNLSRDHIGGVEHPTFEHYMMCKAELFRQCRYGIFNADDPHYTDMVKNAHSINTTFGVNMRSGVRCDLAARDIRSWHKGNLLGVSFVCRTLMRDCEYSLRMPGEFNVYNALAAVAVAQRMNISERTVVDALAKTTVRGRFEIVTPGADSQLDDVVMIIDYAHNAVSMRAALETIRRYKPKRLVVLFGSVGGRTKQRRAELGEVAGQLADFCVITSDNPDFEPPENIIHDIEECVRQTACPYVTFVDRRDAVRYAIEHALPGDLILFAGKGHEQYQIIEGEYRHYDEREEISAAVTARAAKI